MARSVSSSGPPSATQLWLRAAPGMALQLAGLGWALRPSAWEVDLLAGALLWMVGTTVAMWPLERFAVGQGRRDAWAFAAVLGPVGTWLVARLAPGRVEARPRRPVRRSLADATVAVALTLGLSFALLWGASSWVRGYRWPAEMTAAEVHAFERLAFERLQAISAAQTRYRQTDWDGDGAKTYAAFLIHLWQSVDLRGEPVKVELIPRQVGFAMVREFALDGYTFESLHLRAASPDAAKATADERRRGVRELDPAEEWAVVARPAFPRRTGGRIFLADQTGAIWTAPATGASRLAYPGDPASRGWTPLGSVEQLEALQAEDPAPPSSS